MNTIKRHKTRAVWIGPVKVGDGAPVSVQSMTKTRTEDVRATVRQIHELEEIGCRIIRIAVPRMTAAKALGQIKKKVNIPIEADIHFNPKLALEVIKQGVDAVRLNPGNITDKTAIGEIVKQAKARKIPIRVGLNSGSVWGWRDNRRQKTEDSPVPTGSLRDYPSGRPSRESQKSEIWRTMVDCALEYCRYLESLKFRDMMVSLKASDVISTIKAYRSIARTTDYPLHIGVTAAGPLASATVKSALGIGVLLLEGIGDTIRVSVTGPPHDEVRIGYDILEATGLHKPPYEIISCPTCGRCELDIVKITGQVEAALRQASGVRRGASIRLRRTAHNARRTGTLKVAIMGCVVNGPGEAREADIGIAGGQGFGFLFKHGRKIRKIPAGQIVRELIKEIRCSQGKLATDYAD